MIAWAGMEMYTAGWTTALSCRALQKWSLDPAAADGGILGVSAWVKRGEDSPVRSGLGK
jgi:N6-L-threonylcarbamoyladenine synthase